MELLRFKHGSSDIGVRDIEERDIAEFVSYWHDGGADLAFLGIDPAKLGSREETHERFRAYRRSHDSRDAIGFTLFREEEAIGYTNININGRPYGYLHVHITKPNARGQGIVSAILARAPRILHDYVVAPFGLDGIVLETRTRNAAINNVVAGMGLNGRTTTYLEAPDGLAGPGQFNVLVLDRPLLQALAEKERASVSD